MRHRTRSGRASNHARRRCRSPGIVVRLSRRWLFVARRRSMRSASCVVRGSPSTVGGFVTKAVRGSHLTMRAEEFAKRRRRGATCSPCPGGKRRVRYSRAFTPGIPPMLLTGVPEMTSRLFSPIAIGGMPFHNRIAVSPMCQYSADDGSATDWHLQHWMTLAMSGAGMVTIEATGVERRGRITHGCLGLYSDDNEAAAARGRWRRRGGWRGRAPASASSSPMPAARLPCTGRGRAARPSARATIPGRRSPLRPSPLPRAGMCPRRSTATGSPAITAAFVAAASAAAAGRLRLCRDPRRPRLSAPRIPVAARQPARRRLWRSARRTACASCSRSPARFAPPCRRR